MNHQWRDNANKMVRWADKTYDIGRSCDECGLSTCHSPVHEDRYKTLGQVDWEIADQEEAAGVSGSYWNWMHDYQPLGARRDHDGDLVTPELATANPDVLSEEILRNSGVGRKEYRWMNEAFEQLTEQQQAVWDLVMRQQYSEVDVAEKIGISQQAVSRLLDRAKQSVTNYLREKQSDAGMSGV